MQNKDHEKRRIAKRAARAARDKRPPRALPTPPHPFKGLTPAELAKVLPYRHSPQQDIPTDVLHLMYKGLEREQEGFAVKVQEWILARDPQNTLDGEVE